MERNRIRRRILWLLVTIGIGAIVAYALIPSRMLVEAGRVATGPLQVTIDQEGETRAHDRFVMSAPVPGRLLRVELEDGDPVNRDEIVARIDPLPLSQRERQEILAREAKLPKPHNARPLPVRRMHVKIGRKPIEIETAPSALRTTASSRRRRLNWRETPTSRRRKNSMQPSTALKWPRRK